MNLCSIVFRHFVPFIVSSFVKYDGLFSKLTTGISELCCSLTVVYKQLFGFVFLTVVVKCKYH